MKTRYDAIMKQMTPEILARTNVHLVLINGTDPFYMTSIGQLFPFDKLNEAIQFENQWLMSELTQPEEPDKDDSKDAKSDK